jgi:rhodanese-related sulfurtransferase
MEPLTLALAALAFLIAVAAWLKASSLRTDVDARATEARRLVSNVQEEVSNHLELHKAFLSRLAGGEELTPQMIADDQLFTDVNERVVADLVADDDVLVIDVRTTQETDVGFIPGAMLLPIDQFETRVSEIPKEGKKLIYCAAGGRSAAACEYLAREGHQGLMNMVGGIGAYSGPLDRPKS